jgi:hypothetical protein
MRIPQVSAVTARTMPAVPRPARRREEAETAERRRPRGEDDFEETPRRRIRRTSPVLLIALIVGGILLLAGAGVGGYILLRDRPPAQQAAPEQPVAEQFNPLKFMPSDAEYIASVRVAEVRGSAFYQELRKQVPELESKAQKELQDKFKASLDAITSFTAGGQFGPDNDVLVIQTTRPYRAEDLLAQLPGPRGEPEKLGPYTMHTARDLAVAVPAPKVIVMGTVQSVRLVLQRNGEPLFSPALKDALKLVDLSRHIAFAGDLKKARDSADAAQGMAGAQGLAGTNFQAIVQGLQTAGVEVDFGGEANVKATVAFTDAGVAKQAKQAADAIKGMAGLFMPPDATRELNKVDIAAAGNRVVLVSTVSVATVVKGIQDALRKQPGGAFQPQPFPNPRGRPAPGRPIGPPGRRFRSAFFFPAGRPVEISSQTDEAFFTAAPAPGPPRQGGRGLAGGVAHPTQE